MGTRLAVLASVLLLLTNCTAPNGPPPPVASAPAECEDVSPVFVSVEPVAKTVHLPGPVDKETFVEILLRCRLKNVGTEPLWVVLPSAYKIFPHPYEIRVNKSVARLWSGSLMCAPAFTRYDMRLLGPGEECEGEASWNCFVENFTNGFGPFGPEPKPGVYRFALRYRFSRADTFVVGASIDELLDLNTAWSNDVEVELFAPN